MSYGTIIAIIVYGVGFAIVIALHVSACMDQEFLQDEARWRNRHFFDV